MTIANQFTDGTSEQPCCWRAHCQQIECYDVFGARQAVVRPLGVFSCFFRPVAVDVSVHRCQQPVVYQLNLSRHRGEAAFLHQAMSALLANLQTKGLLGRRRFSQEREQWARG